MKHDREFADLLTELVLRRSEAKTTNLSGVTAAGETDRLPLRRLDEREDPAFWTRWMGEQRTDEGRVQVLEELFVVVTKLRYAPAPEERRGTREWRLKVATDPRPSREVAVLYRIHHSTVCRIRHEHGVTAA